MSVSYIWGSEPYCKSEIEFKDIYMTTQSFVCGIAVCIGDC